MPHEIVLQKSHHSCYDNQLTAVGARLVDVVTREDLERAITDRTTLLFFMNVSDGDGQIHRADWVEVARRRGIPTLLDAAADVPPVERLSEYVRLGSTSWHSAAARPCADQTTPACSSVAKT
jgi:L-seryl-tRNA(Ser) seleniumtransferase